MRRNSNSSSSGSGGGVGPLMSRTLSRLRCPFARSAIRPRRQDLAGACGGLVAHQLGEVLVGKATQFGRGRQRAIDWTWPKDLGQRDGGDHLGADARRADRGRTDQPLLSTWSDRQERCLVWRLRASACGAADLPAVVRSELDRDAAAQAPSVPNARSRVRRRDRRGRSRSRRPADAPTPSGRRSHPGPSTRHRRS